MKGIKLMNKLNIIPGFKEGGVGTIAKELGKVVKEPVTSVSDKQLAEKCKEIADKVPAEAYRSLYMPQVNVQPYLRELPKDITPEQIAKAKSPEYIQQLIEGKG